ncbi:uncharacterized protein TNCV_4527081 [Trichonephila clavipes]|nr:uncharacterized protein TNCV_4527081 [Trichonephila clavipes]
MANQWHATQYFGYATEQKESIGSSMKEFSARSSQFKELSETLKFIVYPIVTSFGKLNLSQFDWLEIEESEMQLIDFQSGGFKNNRNKKKLRFKKKKKKTERAM